MALGVVLAGGFWLRSKGLEGVELSELSAELRRTEEPRFEWTSIDKKHWQVLGPHGGTPLRGEATEITDAREDDGAGCESGMVRVHGKYRLGEVERLQDAACTDWISRDFPARCRTFDRERIATDVAKLPTRAMDFCMDRFEYPNVAGESPMIVVTFHEAEAVCKKSNKRLCSETEWTFACEGEDARPYPYGFSRDATACVVDRTWRPFTEGALQPRNGPQAREELDRLWQGEPSGSRGACRSPFGVYDMTGNVDEWTQSVQSTGYASILKGGYWGPVRARCRPSTRAHNEDFVAYQQGFRCCAESDKSVEPPEPNMSLGGGVVDAGSSDVEPSSPAGEGSGPTSALTPPTADDDNPAMSSGTTPDPSDDELRAIAHARSKVFRCSVREAGAPIGLDGGFGAGLVVAAVFAGHARRRRRR